MVVCFMSVCFTLCVYVDWTGNTTAPLEAPHGSQIRLNRFGGNIETERILRGEKKQLLN